MTTPFGYFDLLESLPQPGCAICRLLQRDVLRFLDTLLSEHVVDPETQVNFRASRGLCYEHTWLLPQVNNVLGVGILYDSIMYALLETKGSPTTTSGLARLLGGSSNALADALEATLPCPACAARSRAEDIYVQVLGGYATDERLHAAFAASDGLCLPHFRLVLRAARDPANARLLTDIQRGKWAALKTELELFLRRMDAHYHETMGDESTSWRRALARIAGEPPPKAER